MQKLIELRKKAKMTQAQMAKVIGVSRQAYSNYESGLRKPDYDVLKTLAKYFGTTVDYLLEADLPNNIFPIKTKRIPLLGEIACGEPIFANEEYGEYVMTSDEVDADFCLQAKGDSMKGARILNGDIVFIRRQDMVDNGEIAAVVIDDEATLKRVNYYPDKNLLILKAENPKYPDQIYTNEQLDTVKILGKAIAFQSDVR